LRFGLGQLNEPPVTATGLGTAEKLTVVPPSVWQWTALPMQPPMGCDGATQLPKLPPATTPRETAALPLVELVVVVTLTACWPSGWSTETAMALIEIENVSFVSMRTKSGIGEFLPVDLPKDPQDGYSMPGA
jgi:hypothetical protein